MSILNQNPGVAHNKILLAEHVTSKTGHLYLSYISLYANKIKLMCLSNCKLNFQLPLESSDTRIIASSVNQMLSFYIYKTQCTIKGYNIFLITFCLRIGSKQELV